MDPLFTEDDLKKLNISQLKAICKEKRITAYSKLTKALIIQKILNHSTLYTNTTTFTTGTEHGANFGNRPAYESTLAPSQMLGHEHSAPLCSNPAISVSYATNFSQTQAHIATSTVGVKRSSLLDFPISNALLFKRTKTSHYLSSDPTISTTAPTTTPDSGIGKPYLRTAHEVTDTKRPVCSSSSGSVLLSKFESVADETTPAASENISFTSAQLQRRKVLEEDPLATNVQHNSVTCNTCGKVIKYNMFDLYYWNRHKMRCKPKITLSQSCSVIHVNGVDSSLTAAQASRKITLEEDPLATNIQHDSVTCNACGKVVKYTMYDLYHWNRHKTRCKPDLSLSRSSVISNDDDSSLTVAQAGRKRVLEEDPLATNVLHNSVTCNACGKVVKYTMYDLYHWNKHQARCKPDPSLSQSFIVSSSSTSSHYQEDSTLSSSSTSTSNADSCMKLTAAQAGRRKVLEKDPLAINVQHCSVTCKACAKVVKYTMFDLFLWNKHKLRCKLNATLPQSISSSTIPNNHDNTDAQSSTMDRGGFLSADEVPSEASDDSSLTPAQSERKKALERDPLASSIRRYSVTCKACGKLINYTMFDLVLWNRHKARCKLVCGKAATIAKGKRFTPLVVSKKVASLPSSKAAFTSLGNDLVPSVTPTSSPAISPVCVSRFSEPAMASATVSSTILHDHIIEAPSTSRASAAAVPLSAIPSLRLRDLNIAASGLAARKDSLIPDITLEVNSPTSLSLYHLDFPMSIPLVLNRISMPPALAQRKQVARFAVILSQVAFGDLSNCMLVSRMFRYATYLSASTRLTCKFAGYRLNRIMHRLPASMINMWPYYLQREGERMFRRRLFEESFLGRVFQGRSVIAPQLWTSPDNDKQIVVAIRFLMTRLFFAISVGGQSSNSWLNSMIVDAQEIIKGEIWCISLVQPSESLSDCVESFYVVEATCEVVGFALFPSRADGPLAVQMRVDWSSYIDQRLATSPSLPLNSTATGKPVDPSRSLSSIAATSLLDHLSWTNHEEFTKGISKIWLKKVEIQQGVGAAKRIVAERYILASVVENSVSGRYKTLSEMASDFAGIPTGTTHSVEKKSQVKLNLFLPAHHHVESVHFTTAQGRPLHPALAVVQTSAREYYVLRDNGMQVGCEEDGVASVWMKILGCEPNGERW